MEVLELNEFLQFHEKMASGNDVGSGECQCSRTTASRENLTNHKVKCEEVSCTCDCGQTFSLPVSLNQVNQDKEVDLEHLLEIGVLDHMRQLINSLPSPDQPGHGSCTSTDVHM